MAAFERICSGIPDMDQALDNIRLGDNVVWRVSNLQEFRYFCEPYIEQAIKDNRRIVYFRFASHEPLVKECFPLIIGKNATVSSVKRNGHVTRKKFPIIRSVAQAV